MPSSNRILLLLVVRFCSNDELFRLFCPCIIGISLKDSILDEYILPHEFGICTLSGDFCTKYLVNVSIHNL